MIPGSQYHGPFARWLVGQGAVPAVTALLERRLHGSVQTPPDVMSLPSSAAWNVIDDIDADAQLLAEVGDANEDEFEDDMRWEEATESLLRDVEDAYVLMTKRYSRSGLAQTLAASFFATRDTRRYRELVALSVAKHSTLMLDVLFSIFRSIARMQIPEQDGSV